VVARFVTGLEGAGLFVLKEVYEFRDSGFFDTEAFETGMTNVDSGKPGRMHSGSGRGAGVLSDTSRANL
jgi:hypothetical protein